MKIIVIIPARGGSKGIPKKNLVEVGKKPLIQWSIEAALNSELIATTVVTSDDDNILNFSKTFNEVICVKRPDHLAKDTTPTAPVITHALKELKINSDEYQYLVLLQPTSPLRTAEDINKAIDAIKKTNATALISVNKPEHHPLKSFVKNEEGYLTGLVNNTFPFMPRQELPEVYQPNGAIYIVAIEKFLESADFFTNKTIAYLMDPAQSIDVDSEEDIKRIENQLKI